MIIYKTKWFAKWAKRKRVSDQLLVLVIKEIESGLVDAKLAASIYKKRLGLNKRGKRASVRAILVYKFKCNVFFIYGYKKNAKTNITEKELQALKALADELLGYSIRQLKQAENAGELTRVN